MVIKQCRLQSDFNLVTVNIKHQQFSTVYETPDMTSYSKIISWLHVLNREGVFYQYIYLKADVSVTILPVLFLCGYWDLVGGWGEGGGKIGSI